MGHSACVRNVHAYKTALAELADISAGHPLRVAVDELPEGDVGVVQMRNVDANLGVDWASVSRITLPPSRRVELLSAGDVIFATRGARPYAVALDAPPYPAVCSPHFFVLRVRPEAIDPGFLAWQINQQPAQAYLQREATGSHVLNVRREVVEALEVVVPSLSIQATISSLAHATVREVRLLTALIENRQHQMRVLAAGLHAVCEG